MASKCPLGLFTVCSPAAAAQPVCPSPGACSMAVPRSSAQLPLSLCFLCFPITPVRITVLLVIIIWVVQQSDTTKQWKRKMTCEYQCFGREYTDWREKTRGWAPYGLQQKTEEISKVSKDIRKTVGAASEDQDLSTPVLSCCTTPALSYHLSSSSLFIG